MFQRSREVQFSTPVTLYAARPVALPPVRGGVLDAPRSRDRRGGVVAPVRRGRLHPRFPRRSRLRPPPSVSYPAGTARAPFCTGVRRCPFTHAGRAWKPAPTVDWVGVNVQPASPVIRRKGRRGRRPLRVAARRRYQHRGKQMRKCAASYAQNDQPGGWSFFFSFWPSRRGALWRSSAREGARALGIRPRSIRARRGRPRARAGR